MVPLPTAGPDGVPSRVRPSRRWDAGREPAPASPPAGWAACRRSSRRRGGQGAVPGGRVVAAVGVEHRHPAAIDADAERGAVAAGVARAATPARRRAGRDRPRAGPRRRRCRPCGSHLPSIVFRHPYGRPAGRTAWKTPGRSVCPGGGDGGARLALAQQSLVRGARRLGRVVPTAGWCAAARGRLRRPLRLVGDSRPSRNTHQGPGDRGRGCGAALVGQHRALGLWLFPRAMDGRDGPLVRRRREATHGNTDFTVPRPTASWTSRPTLPCTARPWSG